MKCMHALCTLFNCEEIFTHAEVLNSLWEIRSHTGGQGGKEG